MSKLRNKYIRFMVAAQCKAMALQDKARKALKNEDGDTNFLSIIIILAIVLAVAIVFIALKDEIIEIVEGAWNSFAKEFGGQDHSFDGKDVSGFGKK